MKMFPAIMNTAVYIHNRSLYMLPLPFNNIDKLKIQVNLYIVFSQHRSGSANGYYSVDKTACDEMLLAS